MAQPGTAWYTYNGTTYQKKKKREPRIERKVCSEGHYRILYVHKNFQILSRLMEKEVNNPFVAGNEAHATSNAVPIPSDTNTHILTT